jgi:hypothetical protein
MPKLMDWLDFISSMTKALAWPAAIVASLLIFRKSISRMLPDIRRLKAGPSGLELEWIDRKLDEAREQLEASQEAIEASKEAVPAPEAEAPEAEAPETIEVPSGSTTPEASKQPSTAAEQASRTFMEEITELADVSPEAAILEAYRRLESVLRRTIPRRWGSEYRPPSVPSLVRTAQDAGILTPGDVSVINDLRAIRNALAHDVEGKPNIDRSRALEYAELVRQTIVAISHRTGTIYADQVKHALERAGAGVKEMHHVESGVDMIAETQSGPVAVIVKYRRRSPLTLAYVGAAVSNWKPDRTVGLLIVTNVPLSNEVREFNATVENRPPVEVITWNDERDDGILIRALGRVAR